MEPNDAVRVLTAVESQPAASDEELWPRAITGDEWAFRVIFARHADAVLTQCVRRTGSHIDAEDLTASVFLETWRRPAKVRFVNGSLRPWLLVVASNLVYKHVRTSSRHLAALRKLDPPQSGADVADEVTDNLELRRRARELAVHLNRLNAREREVVAVIDLGELTYSQAADVLEIPIGTVRSRLSRAHAKLRGFLAPDNHLASTHEGR